MTKPREAPMNRNRLVEFMMAVGLGVMSWMAVNIHEISKAIAVYGYRIEDLDRRTQNLETLFLNPTHTP